MKQMTEKLASLERDIAAEKGEFNQDLDSTAHLTSK